MPKVFVLPAVDAILVAGSGRESGVHDDGAVPHVGGRFTRVLHNVLTKDECAATIAACEAAGFEPAAVFTDASGKDVFSHSRSSMRCIVDSVAFAEQLWDRVKPFVPAEGCVGLNERLRILRYDPGDAFAPHQDTPFERTDTRTAARETSKHTILLYLNAGYRGGHTTFYASHKDARAGGGTAVQPAVGAVVAMAQDIVHGVPELTAGRKYVLRTEVMYRV